MKNYFSVYTVKEVFSDLLLAIAIITVAICAYVGFYQLLDPDPYVQQYLSALEIVVAGTICVLFGTVTFIFGAMFFGEFIRKAHTNIDNAKHAYK